MSGKSDSIKYSNGHKDGPVPEQHHVRGVAGINVLSGIRFP